MSSQAAALRQYLADTLVPVVTRVKDVHGVIEDKGAISPAMFGRNIHQYRPITQWTSRLARVS